jgi:hypothetical protein
MASALLAREEELRALDAEDPDDGIQVRMEMGAGVAIYQHPSLDNGFFFQEEEQIVGQIHGRLGVGTNVMGIAAVDFGFARPVLEDGQEGDLMDVAGSLGIGYRLRLDSTTEVEPHLLARISYRKLQGHDQTLSRLGLGFEAGLTIRYFVEDLVGIYIDGGYLLDAPGPRPSPPFSDIPLIAREVFKMVGGVTVGF